MAEVHTPRFASAPLLRYPTSTSNDHAFRNRPRTRQAPRADQQFLTLAHSYRATGGLAWVGDLEAMFMLHSTGSARDFSKSIDDRQVIHFEWQAQTWLPLFQFNLLRMQPHPALSPVLSQLNGIYSNEEVAEWFSHPNPWLDGRCPAQELANNPAAVMDAASAEVFIVCG